MTMGDSAEMEKIITHGWFKKPFSPSAYKGTWKFHAIRIIKKSTTKSYVSDLNFLFSVCKYLPLLYQNHAWDSIILTCNYNIPADVGNHMHP
jgi:hypothetical protein